MLHIQQLPLGPIETNCYLVACDKTHQAAVIDPSWDGRAIAHQATQQGWAITHILLTHTHFDHVAGLAELKEATQAPIYVHPEAVPMLSWATTSAQMWGITFPTPPKPDQMLAAGDIVRVGELALETLYTPGHAPGHVSFYVREAGVVFCGDVLFRLSIGRTDLPGGDFKQLLQTIQTQLLTLPDETVALSGHGPQTTIGFEREHNPFLG